MKTGIALLTYLPGQIGGSEAYVQGLLEEFALGNGPEETHVIANHKNASQLGEFGPKLRVIEEKLYRPGSNSLTRLLAMESTRLLGTAIAREASEAIDVMHYPITVPLPRVESSTTTVVTLHDVQHHDLPHLFSRPERWFRNWAYDESARSADLVVTNSHFSASRIQQHLGIAMEKIHVAPWGIDHVTFNASGERGIIEGVPERYIYFPANSWPHKNHERLIEAFGMIDDPKLSLVLTGADMKGARKRWATVDRVVDLGYVTKTDVASLYRGASAMVYPSLYEGLGLPPLEAMASGCPVVASDIPAIREISADAALLVDPTDIESIASAIRNVVEDSTLRESLKTAGLRHSAKFTWKAAAESHMKAYAKARVMHKGRPETL